MASQLAMPLHLFATTIQHVSVARGLPADPSGDWSSLPLYFPLGMPSTIDFEVRSALDESPLHMHAMIDVGHKALCPTSL